MNFFIPKNDVNEKRQIQNVIIVDMLLTRQKKTKNKPLLHSLIIPQRIKEKRTVMSM